MSAIVSNFNVITSNWQNDAINFVLSSFRGFLEGDWWIFHWKFLSIDRASLDHFGPLTELDHLEHLAGQVSSMWVFVERPFAVPMKFQDCFCWFQCPES